MTIIRASRSAGLPRAEEKACTKCGTVEPIEEFGRDRAKPSGRRPWCKRCVALSSRDWAARNRDRVRAYSKAYRQRPEVIERVRTMVKSSPERQSEYKRRHLLKEGVKEQAAAWRRQYSQRPEVKERARKATAAYRKTEKYAAWKERNREKIRESARRQAARRRASPLGTIQNRISRAINAVLREGKKKKMAFEVVGYSPDDLRRHLQKQFTRGMNWERFMAGEIHIDHIVPVSSFRFSSVDDPELRACWALSNLRPMWAKDNIAKAAVRAHLL